MKPHQKYQFRLNRRSLAAAFVLLMVVVSGSAARARAGQNSAQRRPPIHAASEIGYPPFCIVAADGQAYGFSVELMRAALRVMGRDVTFRTGPWADVKAWLEQGEVQALPLVGRTPEREPFFDFTFPYMSFHGAIVVRKGTTGIRDIEDLRGRRVAVMQGDNAEEFVRREDRGFAIHTTPTFEEALGELSAGRQDAVVIQRLVALRLIEKAGLTNLRIVNQPIAGFRQDWCFAVREGDRDTLALLNEGLALVMADGTFRHLHAKWFAALELPSNRRILIGGDHNFPPFEYLDASGRPQGYNVDLTRALARAVGLDIEIRLGPWTKIRQKLASGEIDAIQGMFYSTERDLTFDFTSSHTAIHYVGVVRKGESPPPATIAELKGKRIVVQQGDIMHEWLLNNGFTDTVTAVATQEKALRELARGRHDCALVARIPAGYWIKKFGWGNLVAGRHSIHSAEYCFAVPKSRKALLAQLSEGMQVLEASGEYRRIYDQWLGVYRAPYFGFLSFLRYAAIGLIPLLLLLLSFFLWSWSLRRKVAQRTVALEKSRKVLNETGKMGRIGGWEHDLLTGRAFWTEALYDIVEVPCDQKPPGVTEHFSYYPFPYRQVLEQAYNRAIRDGTPFDLELEAFTAGKKPIWCRVQGRPEFEKDTCVRMRGTFQDITARKQAEAALIASTARHRLLVDTIPDLIWLKDKKGVYLSCNPTFERFFGAKESDIAGKTDYDFVDKSLADFFRKHDRRAMAAGRPSINEERLTFAADGYRGLFETIKAPLHDAAGNLIGVLGIARDISERKKAENEKIVLERQLKQSQKMEAIGQLAGGIAHNFNNLLSSIIGFTELSLEDVEPGSILEDNLQEVSVASKRARDLVKQILAFARQTDEDREPVKVAAIIKKVTRFIGSAIPATIEIQERLESNSAIIGNAVEIHQILMNLCINAADAMAAGGGILSINLKDKTIDSPETWKGPDLKPGNYIVLEVADTGDGIAPDIIDAIFDPYFTTKGPGDGTGMGLAMVHGIVESYGGRMTVDSTPGKGTAFSIYLPTTTESNPKPPGDSKKLPSKPDPILPGDNERPRQTGRILIVDDEAGIRKLFVKKLGGLGYEIIEAGDGKEALKRYRETQPDLVVTDLIMPVKEGLETIRVMKREFPELKIIAMSGGGRNAPEDYLDIARNLGVARTFSKPLDWPALIKVVQELIDS